MMPEIAFRHNPNPGFGLRDHPSADGR